MREDLLHFIWQFRYFNHRELMTEAGEPMFVHNPGDPNTDQGPDFKNARITIGNTCREGSVELHLKTSDWFRHGHSGDPHYQHVILHVVWENDTLATPGGIPVLELHHRTSNLLLPRYQQFMIGQSFVPCERLLPAIIPRTTTIPRATTMPRTTTVPRTTGNVVSLWPVFRQTLVLERLRARTQFIRSLLDEHRPHWDQTIFWLIARSLGQPINTDAFLTIARTYPLSFLLRRRTDQPGLKSLFLSRAASLDHPLSFLRMRPAHHPHIRLAQLAAILARYPGWFTSMIESDQPAALLETLKVEGLGTATRHSILINAFIPFLYAYGVLRQEPRQREKALRWLESMPPENNTIIRGWQKLGMTAHTAADTQALLELKKNFCAPKKCLDCAIGQSLLTSPADLARRNSSKGGPAPHPAITGQ